MTPRIFVSLFILITGYSALCQTLFTSVQNGAWNDCNTWNTCPGSVAGTDYPGEDDDAVILHDITVNNTLNNDTDGTQQQPDNFAGVCVDNHSGCTANSFHINGKVTIDNGGSLTLTVPVIIGDTLEIIDGTYLLNNTSAETFVLGFLDIRDNGVFNTRDDFSISGNGIATVSALGTAMVRDDVFLDGDNSFLCGEGTWDLNSMGGNESIRAVNNDGETLDQICVETTVTCANGSCCSGNCTADIAASGSDGEVSPGEDPATQPTTNTVLPVVMISFYIESTNDGNCLYWETASEINNDRFEVEFSVDGHSFSKIGEVPGWGTSNINRKYAFCDPIVRLGQVYYRLKQIDFDGKFEIYKTETVKNLASEAVKIYPNPVEDEVTIVSPYLGVTASILSLTGEELFHTKLGTKVKNHIKLDFPPGIYLLKLSGADINMSRTILLK